MIKKWVTYIFPMAFVRWLCVKFTHDNVQMKLGNDYIKVHVWMLGPEEGFFVSDKAQRLERLQRAKEQVREMEEAFNEKFA